jgi:hypothetical protein
MALWINTRLMMTTVLLLALLARYREDFICLLTPAHIILFVIGKIRPEHGKHGSNEVVP